MDCASNQEPTSSSEHSGERGYPRCGAHRLSTKEAWRLDKGIVDVLHLAIECRINPASTFRNSQW
jgi:hypothetical protein